MNNVDGRYGAEVRFGQISGLFSLLAVFMLTPESGKWVLAANAIAWPIAHYAMSRWLQGFAYRVSLDAWTFLLGGALALVVALATVSYQTFRAATANPVEALRYE